MWWCLVVDFGDVIMSWGWSPCEGESVLLLRISECSFSPLFIWGPRENTAICKLGSGPLPDVAPTGTMILDFLASRTIKNKYSLFKLPSLCFICHSSQNGLKQPDMMHLQIKNAGRWFLDLNEKRWYLNIHVYWRINV